MTTIRQVALAAGVSVGTVSRVINGCQNVNAEISARTLAAIRKTRYIPQASARHLGKLRASEAAVTTVAAYMPHSPENWQSNIHHLKYISGMEAVCSRYGYRFVLEASHDEHLPRCIQNPPVAGLLLRENDPDPAFLELLQARCPVVVLGTAAAGCPLDRVGFDEMGVSEMATRHLLAHGHRRIAFLNFEPSHSSFRLRQAGYCEAMRRAGHYKPEFVSETATLRYDGERRPDLQEPLAQLLCLKRPPTAILVANDWGAVALYQALRARHMEPGRDISIMGFDNLLEPGLFVEPGLSTIELPFARVGEVAMQTLCGLLQAAPHERAEPGIHLIPGRVIHRPSVMTLS